MVFTGAFVFLKISYFHFIPPKNSQTLFTSIVHRREEAKVAEAVESQNLVESERRPQVRRAVESQNNPNTKLSKRQLHRHIVS